MNKYQVLFLVTFLFLMSLCVSCSHNEETELLLAVDQDFVRYEVENVSSYTVDEEGALYATGFYDVNCDHSDPQQTNHNYITYLKKYDLEGNLVFTHDFDEAIVNINGLAVNGAMVYFTTDGFNKDGICSVLYSYDTAQGLLERLYDIDLFERVKQLVYLDNRIYILGDNSDSSMNINDSQTSFQSRGEKLVYYELAEKMIYDLEVQNPISIAPKEDGSLMINCYLDKEGYCILAYDPLKDTGKLITKYTYGRFDYFAVSNQGQNLIYTTTKNSRGLIVSGIESLDSGAEIYADASPLHYGVFYQKGQVYCMTKDRNLVRFSLGNIQKDNQSIRYISSGYLVEEPFGCGYTMERIELADDKFALKVLAQDKDYDLCIMNTSSYNSYDIYRNGAFYPLNEVEGIEEYLNACFPYVKEAATDENGNIWMLPIGVDIRGLLVDEDGMAKNQLKLPQDMTYEDFFQMQDNLTDQPKEKINLNTNVLYLYFFAQYFNKPGVWNENILKNKLELFQRYDELMPSSLTDINWKEEFLYAYFRQTNDYESALKQIDKERSRSLRFYSMPKMNSSDKNMGTCTFLAINANSKRRKETLAYLADWISYTMEKENTPFYFQQPKPDQGTLRSSLYELYEKGEITFYIDRDVYVDGFEAVINKESNIDDFIEETKRKLNAYFYE